MKSRLLLIPFLLTAGCSFVPMDLPAHEGINSEEKAAIKVTFGREDTDFETLWNNEGLAQLMQEALDPQRTGKPGEHKTSTLAIALASVGDERFSRVLAKQKPEVIKRVGFAVSPLWTKQHLSYPLTRKLYQAQYEPVKAS